MERSRLKSAIKLARLALEGAADALVDRVKATNQERLEVQFQTIVTDINRTLEPWGLQISSAYRDTVHEALDLRAEWVQQVERERDEQRALREQMREEAAALKEAERIQREAEEDERRAERELARAQQAAAVASDAERARWAERVAELESRLANAHQAKERAVAMAQLTRAGHIYVISNIGSFGDDVFKVGMTRRLDPEDRIIELGDASVPFPFDIHAIVSCEDAPALEAALHRQLEPYRVNLVNRRKEFFKVGLQELKVIVERAGGSLQLTEIAQALQFRQSLAQRGSARASSRSVEAPAPQAGTSIQ